ncbi:hypothetical protein [Streptomyces stelliscabiei]|uniref:hypothetical protein n=1 Tax=Streptomyces stelliscabiei TaxID=146820 RepID=UPI002FF36360
MSRRTTSSRWAAVAGAVEANWAAASVSTAADSGSHPVSERSTWCARSVAGAPIAASSAAALRWISARSDADALS